MSSLSRANLSLSLYFKALCQRFLFLEHLAESLEEWSAQRGLGEKSAEVCARWTKEKSSFARLSREVHDAAVAVEDHVASRPRPLLDFRLDRILDDRPADSFVADLERQILEYEAAFLSCVLTSAPDLTAKFRKIALQWGRMIAHDFLLGSGVEGLSAQLRFRGFLAIVKETLFGGTLGLAALVVRRHTSDCIEFDLVSCPHRRLREAAGLAAEVTDFACDLEARVTRGFATALIPEARHSRTRTQWRGEPHCKDELILRTT
ncbi:MAG: hypothetical protein HYW49_13730 [Deltaproteobacteria bacterium]|nr:hypothetical protein [Deltaproteobacteria bacterium]